MFKVKYKTKNIFTYFVIISIIFISFVSVFPYSSAVSLIVQSSSTWGGSNVVQVTLPLKTTIGNTLLAFAEDNGGSCSISTSDNNSNTWHALKGIFETSGCETVVSLYLNVTTSQALQVQFACTCSGATMSGQVYELSGNKWHFSFANGTSTNVSACGCKTITNLTGIYGMILFGAGANPNSNTFTPTSGQWSLTTANNAHQFIEYYESPNPSISTNFLVNSASGSDLHYWAELGLLANSGNNIITTTYTQTITGWVFPNFIDGTGNISWFYMLGIMLFPVGFIAEIAYKQNNGALNLDSKSPIFLTLVSLFIGSLIGTFTNFIPVVFVFLLGIILALYIWRGS